MDIKEARIKIEEIDKEMAALNEAFAQVDAASEEAMSKMGGFGGFGF